MDLYIPLSAQKYNIDPDNPYISITTTFRCISSLEQGQQCLEEEYEKAVKVKADTCRLNDKKTPTDAEKFLDQL